MIKRVYEYGRIKVQLDPDGRAAVKSAKAARKDGQPTKLDEIRDLCLLIAEAVGIEGLDEVDREIEKEGKGS